DLLGIEHGLTKRYKKVIKEKYGFKEDEILLSSSHTHSGPQTTTNMHPCVGVGNSEYIEFLLEQIIKSVDEAIEDMEPTQIYTGKGTCNIGINRRLIVDGKAQFAPNEEGVTDKDVTVIKFISGEVVKAIIYSYACHPSTIDTDDVSGD